MRNTAFLFLTGIIVFALVISCSSARDFGRDRPSFDSSAVITKYKAVADMNDAYFIIKENHFFQFYRLLFDSVQNSNYAGRYTQNGDTLFLQFYKQKGLKLLGSKALVSPDKKEIIFFDKDTRKKKLIFN